MICRYFMVIVVLLSAFGCSSSDGSISDLIDHDNDDRSNENDAPLGDPNDGLVSGDPQYLYVQTAETADMISNTSLVIPVTRDIFAFTDRPARQFTYLTATEYAALWDESAGSNSFSADPPNAVLTWVHGDKVIEAEVIIRNVTVDYGGTLESLVYEVTLETATMPHAQMSSVSLFVDGCNAACIQASVDSFEGCMGDDYPLWASYLEQRAPPDILDSESSLISGFNLWTLINAPAQEVCGRYLTLNS